MVQPTPVSGNSCWAPSAQEVLMRHQVMFTVVAVVCAVAFASRASAQAAATPSAGPLVVHAPDIRWADGPPFLPRGAPFALLEGNPAEAVPRNLRLMLDAKRTIQRYC